MKPQSFAELPRYLQSYAEVYRSDPRKAALECFRESEFGLFLHYGLYSLLGGEWNGVRQTKKGSEWIQWELNIPRKAYMGLQQQFTAEKFDAHALCDLALEAGMRYINLTTQHHDGFCLWDTDTTDFSSMQAPARRDLVAELTRACAEKGLGCHLYYSHGRDWWHPDSPLNGEPSCRPDYGPEDTHFHTGGDYDINRYLDLVEKQVLELCQYKDVASIWLDGIGGFRNMENGVEISRCQDLYDKIHATSPHILVAYKQGLTYTEDFYAPERQIHEQTVPHADRPMEICTTLQPQSWGYKTADDGNHQSADWVMDQLKLARIFPANLLLNSGPKGDGSIPEEDQNILREVGNRFGKIS
jgi:alpha-L-fucosidase